MRIGIVCPYAWDVPGGVQTHVRDLTDELIILGHDVSVLAPVDDDTVELPPYVVNGGAPVAVKYNGSVARLSFGFTSTSRVRRWIREGEFDVVHVHEPLAPSLSLLACWAARGPMVATWHSSMARSRTLSAGYYIAQTAMEKLSARIAVSEYARRTLVDHIGGDAVLIPNGVTVRAYSDPTPLDGWPKSGPSVLFLGRLDEPRKGLSILLEAWPAVVAAYPDASLLIAGPGDIEEITSKIPESLRANIFFLGRISDADKVKAFHSVDVYVAPNTGGESFGIVLLEAMSSSTAVVASDIDAFARVLDGGSAGRLFANEDSADLGRVLIDVLGDDAGRQELAERGRLRADTFDWARVAKSVVAVYESIAVPGVLVEEDLRGQIVGRLPRLGLGDKK